MYLIPFKGSIGCSALFESKYSEFIYTIGLRGQFTSGDLNTYFDLCSDWDGYSGNCDNSVSPELILNMFRKPHPPKPPTNP